MAFPRPSTRSFSRKFNLSSYTASSEGGRLPSDLPDTTNNQPQSVQSSAGRRHVFEAMIAACTVVEEPRASPIDIRNDIDSEACPPFSFLYTNKLYRAPDIPSTDIMNLQGCDCKGECNPEDGSCSCSIRQEAVVRRFTGFEDHVGFMYERDGSIKDHGLPVFECNITCRCSERCMNRVSMNDYQRSRRS